MNMTMTPRWRWSWRTYAVLACAAVLALGAAFSARGQASSSDTKRLRDELRPRYDIVMLREGLGLVPRQRQGDVRLIEIRNGGVAINGTVVSAREAREQLGQDADLILRITYLDAAAQRDLARADVAAPASPADAGDNANAPPPDLEPATPARTRTHRGDLVRIGGSVTVLRDELVQGDVVAIGGSADVDGEVTGEVTVIGGTLNLGPDAVVRRDVSVVGGTLNRSAGARLYGAVNDVGVGAPFPSNRRLGPNLSFWARYWRVGGLFGTLLRMTLLILGALLVVALGGRFVEAVADRAASEPLRSGLAGLLAEVLFLPLLLITIVVLAVSIIGIPLLLLVPFGIVLAIVLMFVGFTGVACLVGRLASSRFGIQRGPYATAALGVVAVLSFTLLARIIALVGGLVFGLIVAGPFAAVGYLFEYLAWTVGTGAIVLTWLSTRRRAAPTPAAAAPPAGEPLPH
jgi:hypothetical protein